MSNLKTVKGSEVPMPILSGIFAHVRLCFGGDERFVAEVDVIFEVWRCVKFVAQHLR